MIIKNEFAVTPPTFKFSQPKEMQGEEKSFWIGMFAGAAAANFIWFLILNL